MKKILSITMCCVLLSGCASLIGGRYKTINISTSTGESTEATVSSASGMQMVTLPTTVVVKKSGQPVSISVKETKCTKPSNTIVADRLDGWFWGNIITGGVFGSTTDAATGAMWTYDDNVIVQLNKKEVCSK